MPRYGWLCAEKPLRSPPLCQASVDACRTALHQRLRFVEFPASQSADLPYPARSRDTSMEAASARMAARDRFGGWGEPPTSQLQRFICRHRQPRP